MNSILPPSLLLLIALTPAASAQVLTFGDEGAFLAALTAHNLVPVQESFEDDVAWGAVRSSIVGGSFMAPSVTSAGVTWAANNAGSGITTGSGPARTGAWGFFQLPHGDPAGNIRDGCAESG